MANVERQVCGVILTYRPAIQDLDKLVRRVAPQVDAVVVIDNTPEPDVRETVRASISGANYLALGKNHGVAKGFNAGIAWARERNFSHVLLLDQDSLPGETMVGNLMRGESILLEQGNSVAAVGPNYNDPKYRILNPFSRTGKWRVRRVSCTKTGTPYVPADFVITSGALIRISVLDSLGELDERLFIDYVDMEWGLRARNHGLGSFGICDAAMEHSLAEDAVFFWFLKKWSVPVHTPLRHYYYFRNALLMYRRDYIPLAWKARDLGMLLLKAGFFIAVPSPRLQRFRMIAAGLYDGLLNRHGPYRATGFRPTAE